MMLVSRKCQAYVHTLAHVRRAHAGVCTHATLMPGVHAHAGVCTHATLMPNAHAHAGVCTHATLMPGAHAHAGVCTHATLVPGVHAHAGWSLPCACVCLRVASDCLSFIARHSDFLFCIVRHPKNILSMHSDLKSPQRQATFYFSTSTMYIFIIVVLSIANT